MRGKTVLRTLYLCDGNACRTSDRKEHCWINGGDCHHTEKRNHSISENSLDFPSTEFALEGGCLVERRDSSKYLQDLVGD